MDQKISQFNAASTVAATDILPIVSEGANLKLSIGVLSLNLPNIGNSGITKNVPVSPSGTTISLLNSLVGLSVAATYSLAVGGPGQEITIVNKINTPSNLNYGSGSVTIGARGAITLVCIDASWFVKSSNNCTFV